MIPTSTDIVHRTSVWVGDNATVTCTADTAAEQAVIVLGGNCEIAVGEPALRRLHALIGDALTTLDEQRGADAGT